MKKILIFSVAYAPFIGGAEIAVQEITRRLTNIEFHIITINLDGKQKKYEVIDNTHIYRLGKSTLSKFIFPITGFLKAQNLEKINRFDATWSIMASQASVAASFFKIFHPKIPLILTIQEGDEESHLKRYAFNSDFLYSFAIKPWHSLVFKMANKITVISNFLKERAQKMNKRVPIEIIPNGVDLDLFSKKYSEIDLEPIFKEFQKKQDEKIIITTSRLVEKNGIGDLVASLEYLPQNIKLIIIGKGDLEFSLRQFIEKKKLIERVIFLGTKKYEEIPKYLCAADIFIRPSLSEGMGNSFIEAMAAGIPIIGTNVGGIPDFLIDGKTGLMVEIHNPHDIAQKIEKLLSDEILKNSLILGGKEAILKKYEWDTIAEKMEKALLT